jgi:hypothetical protein
MAIKQTTTGSLQRKFISSIITLVIIFMVAANGIFTYFGAHLYLDEWLYAVLFAVAVQFTIASTLITLPFVHGFGKIILIIVYSAAFILSTLSAYTYIYNSSLPESVNEYTIDTALKAQISNDLSDVIRAEKDKIGQTQTKLQELNRLVAEEEARGGRSGLGPGKGKQYYDKVDQYEKLTSEFELQESNLVNIQTHLNTINKILSSRSSDVDREKLLVEFSSLRSNVNTQRSQDILANINSRYLGELQNPVERAISALTDSKEAYSIQLVVSIIWAAVFDLIALFLGIVRYYLLRPNYSILQSTYDGLANFTLFLTRLRYMPKQVSRNFHREAGLNQSDEVPLNSAEMQTFATKLLAGIQMAQPVGDDPAEPIKTLLALISPVDIKGDDQAVGISFESMESEPRLKMLLAMLVQSQVFIKHSEQESYVLNSDEKLSQKMMVMIRMGMKEDPQESGMVSFLVNDSKSSEPESNLDSNLDRNTQSTTTVDLSDHPVSGDDNNHSNIASKRKKKANWGNTRNN